MNKILVLIIAVLVLFTAFNKSGGCSSEQKKADTITLHDTTFQVHDSLIVKRLKVKQIIHDTLPPEYIADTNYPKLKAQYDTLVKEYLAKNTYTDTLKIDSIGWIAVADTVKKNQLENRSYKWNYKIPVITNTITIQNYEKPKNQIYIGGGIDVNKGITVNNIHIGGLLKTKKDHILGITIGTQIDGGVVYGFQSYWKIKLR
jgi:hypothetical protein